MLLMEHQKRNYLELSLDSLKNKGWLRYLCYLYKNFSIKMPPCFYEILPPLQMSQRNPGCFKPFNIVYRKTDGLEIDCYVLLLLKGRILTRRILKRRILH